MGESVGVIFLNGASGSIDCDWPSFRPPQCKQRGKAEVDHARVGGKGNELLERSTQNGLGAAAKAPQGHPADPGAPR